jgi:hypothetical protein
LHPFEYEYEYEYEYRFTEYEHEEIRPDARTAALTECEEET